MAMKQAETQPANSAPRSDILPLPEPRFCGRIGTYYTDSEAEIPAMPSAPPGAPNVLLVLLDDAGFGHASTFGGPVNTPTLQRLADEALVAEYEEHRPHTRGRDRDSERRR